MDERIKKAEEWANRLKQALPDSTHKEYVQEHIELLEWLIEQVREARRS